MVKNERFIIKAGILIVAMIYIISPMDLMPLMEIDDGVVGILAGYLLKD